VIRAIVARVANSIFIRIRLADLFLLFSLLREEMGMKRIPTHFNVHLPFKLLRDRFRDNYFYAGLGSSVSYQ
jgi:hypothetical protein